MSGLPLLAGSNKGGSGSGEPQFGSLVDPQFLQDQQSNLFQSLLAQSSAIGQPAQGAGMQQFPSMQGSPFQTGYGYDPSLLDSLFS